LAVVEFISIAKCRRLVLSCVEVSYRSFWFCLRYLLVNLWLAEFRGDFFLMKLRVHEVSLEENRWRCKRGDRCGVMAIEMFMLWHFVYVTR
jgi:hypothetical protein